MLANRMALAIPAFVDLFTRHLQHLAFAITQIIDRYRESVQPIRPVCQGCGLKAKHRLAHGYLRRDFAFAVAITAIGGATVISASTKTITKPNMIFPAFFEFSVEQQEWRAARAISHHPLGCCNPRKVAETQVKGRFCWRDCRRFNDMKWMTGMNFFPGISTISAALIRLAQ
jgi:hypothetical protein